MDKLYNIPLIDLKRQYASLKQEIDSAIQQVLTHAQFIMGDEVILFEKEFAQYNNALHCISVNSGTDALMLCLEGLGITHGDEVIVPANTFVATAFAVTAVGATPIFVDVNPLTYIIDPTKIEKKITSKTKAIIPVHLYGQAAPMDEIIAIAKKYSLLIIEDACQAHGAIYKGKHVGTFGTAGCFSFYPGKNLGAYGDGGAIITNNTSLAQELILLRQYGEKKKYEHQRYGRNSRLDTIQAAVLRIKLKHLSEWNALRIKQALSYDKCLCQLIKKPQLITDGSHVYHLYVIQTEKRDALQDHLAIHGISTGIHYPIPLYLQQAYASFQHKKEDFPISEMLSHKILSLPMFPELTSSEIEYIASVLNQFCEHL